jgi:predicted branched-subunit amino acid permease
MTMPSETLRTSFAAEFRAGAATIAPAAVAVVPFAVLFGALAAQKGLSMLEVGLMSGLVFAGSAQFVSVDIWREPAPWLLLAFTTLIINLRHVMMGASLSRRLGAFSPPSRAAAVFLMADEIWALAERRAADTRLTPAFYAGMAVPLYINWIGWTVAGAGLGAAISNPAAWGFDFAFIAIFIGLIVGFWKGPATGIVIAASAITAILVERLAGGVWHIVAGGLAGMIIAAIGVGARRDA